MQNIGLLTLQAAARAGGVMAGSLALAVPLRDGLAASQSRPARRVAWALLLVPFLMPSLLMGYVYLPVALALVRQPLWKELLYDLILLLRLTPAAVLALTLSPPPLTAAALHCHRLLAPSGWRTPLGFRLRGAGRGPWVAAALVFLLVYGDFDLATMWNLKTWTAALFDAQAGGLALDESLRLAAWPLGGALAATLALMTALGRNGWLGASPDHRPPPPGRAGSVMRWVYLAFAATLTAGWPLARLLPEAWAGAGALVGNVGLGHDIVFTALLATCAAVAVWLVAGEGLQYPWMGFIAASPGLLGALLLSLLLLAVFQWPGLHIVYHTPLPLLVALTFMLLPIALLLRWLRLWTRPGAALYLAGLVPDQRLRWQLDGRKTYWAGFLLFCWAYFDLTAAALLAPPGLTTVALRVFNLMHYGRTPALSAMLVAAVAVPAAGAFLVAAAWQKLLGWKRVRRS